MRKLIVSSLVLAAVACESSSTSPNVAAVSRTASFYQPGTVPPPPLDSGSYASNEYGTSTRIGTTYFLNRPGTNGWLAFQKDQAAGTVIDNNARVSYNSGDVSGKGTLSYLVSGGRVTIDLSSVSDKSTFNNSTGGYFNLAFTRGSYTPTGGTPRALTRASTFSMTPPKEVCVGDRVCGGSR